jgi:hypothetical protein
MSPNYPSGHQLSQTREGGKLQEFAIVLEQAKTAHDRNGLHGWPKYSTHQLWEKQPSYLRSKWCERANAIRVAKGKLAGFEDFVQFVTKQADLATDPDYSEEPVTKESSQRKDFLKTKGMCYG